MRPSSSLVFMSSMCTPGTPPKKFVFFSSSATFRVGWTKVSLKQLSSYIESEFETVPTLDTFPNTLLTGTWAAVTHFHQLETEALSKKSKQFSSVFLHLVWAQGPYIRLMSSWYRSCTNTSTQISSAKYDTKVAKIFRKNLEWKIRCKFICSGRLVSFMAEVT